MATLRRAAGLDPDDPRPGEVVGELSLKGDDFRTLWARHDGRTETREAKHFRHFQVDDLELHYESFTVGSVPTRQLVVHQAEPGTRPPTPSPCSARSAPAWCPRGRRSRALSPTE